MNATMPCLPGETRATETLLLVDDDPAYRWLEAEVLGIEGFKILQADGAKEALRMAGSTDAIHLLVTDYSMPDGDGLELARRFRSLHPETPVLLVSGLLPALGEKAGRMARFETMEKPFEIPDLVRKVRAMLSEPDPMTS